MCEECAGEGTDLPDEVHRAWKAGWFGAEARASDIEAVVAAIGTVMRLGIIDVHCGRGDDLPLCREAVAHAWQPIAMVVKGSMAITAWWAIDQGLGSAGLREQLREKWVDHPVSATIVDIDQRQLRMNVALDQTPATYALYARLFAALVMGDVDQWTALLSTAPPMVMPPSPELEDFIGVLIGSSVVSSYSESRRYMIQNGIGAGDDE
jgi:hypothetical protein